MLSSFHEIPHFLATKIIISNINRQLKKALIKITFLLFDDEVFNMPHYDFISLFVRGIQSECMSMSRFSTELF